MTLPSYYQKFLTLIQAQPGVTLKELAEETGYKVMSIRPILADLELGYIRSEYHPHPTCRGVLVRHLHPLETAREN